MTNLPETLAAWAGEFLPQAPRLSPLAGDASARRYFRLEGAGLLAMHGPDAVENAAYWHIGKHLKGRGLPLPELQAFNPERGFFLMEDLGDAQLSKRLDNGPAPDVYEACAQTVRVMADFHRRGFQGFQTAWCCQEPVYNAPMILEKEVLYFLRSFMGGYLGEPAAGPELLAEAGRFSRAVAREAPPAQLIHRDFQGRNVMLGPGGPALIDWQGARLGPGAYDLASLLLDPSYTAIPQAWREDFIAIYLKAMGRTDEETFRRELLLCGAARLMQILGAFGKLCGEGKNYARWMRPAAQRLVEHLSDPALKEHPLLAACAARALEKL